MSTRGGRGGGRGGASAAASGSKRKSAHTDDTNSNTRMFKQPSNAVTVALKQRRGAAAGTAAATATSSASAFSSSAAPSASSDEFEVDRAALSELRLRDSVSSMQPVMPDTHTANGDDSFSTTRCARLDLFYRMVRGAESDAVRRLCSGAWLESPEHSVQLLMHSRDARGGKGERLISLYGLMWMRDHKPLTYLLNLTTFIGLGYFKDLLQIAVMVSERKCDPMGENKREDVQRKQAAYIQRQSKKASASRLKAAAAAVVVAEPAEAAAVVPVEAASASAFASSAAAVATPREIPCEILELEILAEYLKQDWVRLQAYQAKLAVRKAKIEEQRRLNPEAAAAEDAAEQKQQEEEEKKQQEPKVPETKEEELAMAAASNAAEAAKAAEAAAASSEDDEWEQVAVAAAAPSADASAASMDDGVVVAAPDAKAAKVKKPRGLLPHLQLSLAAKWAPSEGSSFDKKHHLAKRLARLMFPGDPKCFRLYREALSACRTHLNVTERHMCSKRYDLIDFEKIPSKCHQLLKKALGKACGERYTAYQQGLRDGTKKINTAGIMPHELATPYITGAEKSLDETIEGAWRTLVSKLKAKCSSHGGLASAVAVVDVSGSMTCFSGLPMNVAISLGLLVSELAVGPFQGRMITFHEKPSWHQVPQNTSLFAQVQSVKAMSWGMSTDLRAVFNMILATATASRCHPDDLPKTIFIFSDMQFNAAVRDRDGIVSEGKGIHHSIKSKYEAAGYTVPNVVYWNLNGLTHGDFPVDVSTPGVALIGGYSAELLKAFLEGQNIDPVNIMMHSIAPYKAIIEDSERDGAGTDLGAAQEDQPQEKQRRRRRRPNMQEEFSSEEEEDEEDDE